MFESRPEDVLGHLSGDPLADREGPSAADSIHAGDKTGLDGMTERLALRVPEVAELLGTPQRTIYRWIAEGRLPTIRVGRVVLVPRRALEEWIERETRH